MTSKKLLFFFLLLSLLNVALCVCFQGCSRESINPSYCLTFFFLCQQYHPVKNDSDINFSMKITRHDQFKQVIELNTKVFSISSQLIVLIYEDEKFQGPDDVLKAIVAYFQFTWAKILWRFQAEGSFFSSRLTIGELSEENKR